MGVTVSAETNQSIATIAPINVTQLPLPYQYMQYALHPFFPPFYHQYPLPPSQPQVPVNAIAQQVQQHPPAQQQLQQQQGPQARPSFPPIPMTYSELLPTLLIDQGKLSFENNVPHILDNPLPNHAAVNMIEAYEETSSLNVRNVATPLVPLHVKMCQASLFNHDHAACNECL